MDSADTLITSLQNWMKAFMSRSMRDSVVYARQNGLSMAHFGTLLRISQSGCSNVSCIGEEMGISNPAASQMIDRLVQMGLVSRGENPTDRRLKQITITERGEHILQGGLRARDKWWGDLDKLLSSSERAQVIAAFGILIEKAKLLEPESTS